MSYPSSGPASAPGGSSYNTGGPAVPAVSQAGLQDVFNSWVTSLTRPSAATYANEATRATQNRIWLSVGAAVIISAILGLISGILGGNMVGDFIKTLVLAIIQFVIVAGSYYAGAKIMKGTATLEQHAWVTSTYWAPITVLSNIPLIGWLLGLVGAFYMIYLEYLTIQGVQRLDGQNAMIATGIGAVIAVVVGWIVAIIVGIILLAIGLTTATTTNLIGG